MPEGILDMLGTGIPYSAFRAVLGEPLVYARIRCLGNIGYMTHHQHLHYNPQSKRRPHHDTQDTAGQQSEDKISRIHSVSVGGGYKCERHCAHQTYEGGHMIPVKPLTLEHQHRYDRENRE